jgi:hypothetical protein
MLILSEKIAPPRRSQILDNYVVEDAALKKSLAADENRWVMQFIDGLAGFIWKIGKRG